MALSCRDVEIRRSIQQVEQLEPRTHTQTQPETFVNHKAIGNLQPLINQSCVILILLGFHLCNKLVFVSDKYNHPDKQLLICVCCILTPRPKQLHKIKASIKMFINL